MRDKIFTPEDIILILTVFVFLLHCILIGLIIGTLIATR